MNARVCEGILWRQVWYMVGVVDYTDKWLYTLRLSCYLSCVNCLKIALQ